MAKSHGIRKTLEQLIKKVETLENQSFAQKLLIDELEGKVASAEEAVKKMKEDPFGLGHLTTVPYVQTATPTPPAQPYLPLWNPPQNYHICNPGPTDWTGGSYCTVCGVQLTGQSWTVMSNTDGTTISLGDPSSDVEPTLDLDISWVVPDDTPKY